LTFKFRKDIENITSQYGIMQKKTLTDRWKPVLSILLWAKREKVNRRGLSLLLSGGYGKF
jgi:hypothetical protein